MYGKNETRQARAHLPFFFLENCRRWISSDCFKPVCYCVYCAWIEICEFEYRGWWWCVRAGPQKKIVQISQCSKPLIHGEVNNSLAPGQRSKAGAGLLPGSLTKYATATSCNVYWTSDPGAGLSSPAGLCCDSSRDGRPPPDRGCARVAGDSLSSSAGLGGHEVFLCGSSMLPEVGLGRRTLPVDRSGDAAEVDLKVDLRTRALAVVVRGVWRALIPLGKFFDIFISVLPR